MAINFLVILTHILLEIIKSNGASAALSWDDWWTYDGISGPQYWGLLNPDWSLCARGKYQSPVNIEPRGLLYDPNLNPLHIDKHKVPGILHNTGNRIVLTLNSQHKFGSSNSNYFSSSSNSSSSRSRRRDEREPWTSSLTSASAASVNISGGPVSYSYSLSHLQFHFGSQDRIGSEHTVNGSHFPAEIEIYGYNSELYNNYSEAAQKSNGLVAISIMVQIYQKSSPGLRQLTSNMQQIRYAGSRVPVDLLSIIELLPTLDYYMTYEGSLTHPPCYETVTWIIINKPVYIDMHQLKILRTLNQGTLSTPKARMVNNFRPTQLLYNRPVRTNIDVNGRKQGNCGPRKRKVMYTAKRGK